MVTLEQTGGLFISVSWFYFSVFPGHSLRSVMEKQKKQIHKCNIPAQTFYSRVLGVNCIFLLDCGVWDGRFLLLP